MDYQDLEVGKFDPRYTQHSNKAYFCKLNDLL